MQCDIDSLLEDLHATRKEVRAEAARQLGHAGIDALPGLLQALQDPDWVVRYRAVEALMTIQDALIDTVLITTLNDERDHVRYISAKGLGIRKVRSGLVPLIHSLRDKNEFVRMGVARSLALLGDPQALPSLREAIEKETIARVAGELKKAVEQLEGCQ